MALIEFGRRRLFILLASAGVLILLFNILSLSRNDHTARISNVELPSHRKPPAATEQHPSKEVPGEADEETPGGDDEETSEVDINIPDIAEPHPIRQLRHEADQRWRKYQSERSLTLRQTVEKYRRRYGRHPPPGFKEWYKFARERNVFNIDDFDQVMDDLRPFWAIDPKTIRLHAAHMWENPDDGIAGIHIRNHRVAHLNNHNWRSETLQKLIESFVEYLPDMDIAMNRLDQPRLVVPWEDMQTLLAKEYETRAIPAEVVDSFTTKQDYLLDITIEDPKDDTSERLDADWVPRPGKPYLELASLACPPDSPVRTNMSESEADSLYKDSLGGLITNFNRSTDLCIAGPALQNRHGFLYSASSMIASKKLLPVFGECKVNVNSDILFPANMYHKHDERYEYSPEDDLTWEDKTDTLFWRGVSSGGVQNAENWSTMHRQRLVQLLNGTTMSMAGREVRVVSETGQSREGRKKTYENFDHFQPSRFAEEYTDVGFVELVGCLPGDCPFYKDVFSLKPQVTLSTQFRNKYLIDVDGATFSGRWRAFLQSKSLGLKATIFREWHDSRLFAWQHFVPVDNRYDDLYSLLTYFIGYGEPHARRAGPEADDHVNTAVYMPSHDGEAKEIARQGREWAEKVLRTEDMEVYMFRLLLEYGRIIDDNRDRIGYSEEGSRLDKVDDEAEEAAAAGGRWGLGRIFGKTKTVSNPN